MPTTASPTGLTLNVTDNRDGTATFDVSGAGSNALTLSSARVGGADASWFPFATAGGDGAVTSVFDEAGYWAALSLDDRSDQTPPVYFAVTNDAVDANWWQAMNAAQATIVGLGLDGLDPSRVEVYKVPVNQNLSRVLTGQSAHNDGSPAVIISPAPERVQRRRAGQQYTVLYGCTVSIFQANEGSPEKHLAKLLKWRERIRLRFDERSDAVSGAMKTTVEPGEVFPLGVWARGYDTQSLVVRAHYCERGS